MKKMLDFRVKPLLYNNVCMYVAIELSKENELIAEWTLGPTQLWGLAYIDEKSIMLEDLALGNLNSRLENRAPETNPWNDRS